MNAETWGRLLKNGWMSSFSESEAVDFNSAPNASISARHFFGSSLICVNALATGSLRRRRRGFEARGPGEVHHGDLFLVEVQAEEDPEVVGRVQDVGPL